MRACQSLSRSLLERWIAFRKTLSSVEHDLGRLYGSECEGVG
jgi:hypothetical protein